MPLEEYQRFLSRSARDATKITVDWEGMQLGSLAARGEAMLRARYLVSQAMLTPGFFGPAHYTVGDGSDEAYLLEFLPACLAVTFDERGDSTPRAADSRSHPNGLKLLPALLRTRLTSYQTVAQQLYLDNFMNGAPDPALVRRLVYKVILMHSLCVCVLVFECVHVCVLCV
jgi:hypothetical protein